MVHNSPRAQSMVSSGYTVEWTLNGFADTRLTLTKFIREYIMSIDVTMDGIDFSCNTIDDLILADIRLNAIVKELPNYQYEDACGNNEMDWVTEKHQAIKIELERRLGTWNKNQIKKLRNNKLNISIDEIKDRINYFKGNKQKQELPDSMCKRQG